MVTRPDRRTAATVTAFGLVLIAAMTIRPAVAAQTLPFNCVFCGSLGGVDFVLNIILFVPLGLGAYWLLGSGKKALLLGASVTFLVELLQWRLIPGRDASLGDLLANSLGSALGIGLAFVGPSWLSSTGRLARRLAAGFAVLFTAVIIISTWLMQPVRVQLPLSVQWQPRRPNMDDFRGDVRAASLNGVPIRATELLRPLRLMDAQTRSLSVQASVRGSAPPTRRQAVILRLANHREEGFFLGQWRDLTIVRTHVVAERFKFRPLLVGLEALPTPGDNVGPDSVGVIVHAESNPRAITIALERPGSPASVTVRRTAGQGWTLLLPWDVAVTPRWWLANPAWLGALILPAGFFTARSTRHDASSGVSRWWPLAMSVVVVIVGPAMFGLGVLGVGEWVGLLAGIIAGAALERLIATDLRPLPNERMPARTTLT